MSVPDLAQELPAAVTRAAGPGLTVYTERQLYYEVCRGLRPFAAEGSLPSPAPPAVEFESFQAAVSAFGRSAGLLDETLSRPLPLEGREPDLTHYGISRILLCQDPSIARMLRANGFPMEAGCAVIAHPRPMPLPPPLDDMAALARRAAIFALHDASPEGLRWAGKVSARRFLPRGARFRAVGLRPVHARRLQLPAPRNPSPDLDGLPPTLAPAERAWLAEGWSAEVAAVPPARLMRALRRIVRETTPRPTPELAQSRAGYMTWP